MNLSHIQEALLDHKMDGWLFFDFRGSDPIAHSLLELDPHLTRTRRWAYFIPARGAPVKIVHAIETGALENLPGDTNVYLSHQSLEERLSAALSGASTIAMQYSPRNAIPYVSRVDAGVVEMIRSFGVEVVSSADLIQLFQATLRSEQAASHQRSALALGRLIEAALEEIVRQHARGRSPSEYEIQQFLLAGMEREGLLTDHAPIVAVGPNAADPHFAPSATNSAPISKDTLVLIDLWAKEQSPGSIFADLTWMSYTGPKVPERIAHVFSIVAQARDAAAELVETSFRAGAPVRGCDVDDVARAVIETAGFGARFIHRTGHSIHESGHGNGANMDNLETRDERRLLPSTVFSIEPGIYLPGEFGVRSEINVLIDADGGPTITGPIPQQELSLLTGGAGPWVRFRGEHFQGPHFLQ